MRTARICLAAAILLGGTALAADPTTAPAPVAPPPPLPTSAPATPATPAATPVSPAIQAILAARDPSATIEAYARGVSADPNDVELERAYVRHMVDLGAPEMADAQAHDLVKRGGSASDPLARGVAAYNDAARGNAPAAIANLKPALAEQPDNPFLLRTAGQIVAWYDGTLDRSNLSKDDVASIEWMRTAGAGRAEFAEAYRMATDARRRSAGAPSASSSEPYSAESAAAPVAPGGTTPMPPPTTYYNYPADDDGYAASGYRYYYPYYAYDYFPAFSSIIIIRDCDFHRHRHFGRDFDHDHDRDGVTIHRWGEGGRDGHWDGIITRPEGWVTRRPSNFVGPLPADPANGGVVRSGRDARDGRDQRDAGTAGVLIRPDGSNPRDRRDSAPVVSGPQPAPQSPARSRGSSSAADRSADRPQARPSPVPTPKYDSPQPRDPAPSRSSASDGGSRSGGGGASSGSHGGGGGGGSPRGSDNNNDGGGRGRH